ncbi:MAG: PspA/IM30 family protein [Lachnospiraceae bacterium]|nr:PspA/IM30 family protein [Lachnospiraceae bacterium]
MGVLSRFKDIMSANINSLLDKAEDPEKMVDQILRNLNKDLANVKEETAEIMADEKKAKRDLDEVNAEVAKLQTYAEKAVLAGNDDDATKFLAEKARVAEKQAALQQAYDAAVSNSTKMRQMHDKLVEDIRDLEARRDTVKAKVKVAKTQDKINQMNSSLGDSASSIAAFERMEDKADAMMDISDAEAELNSSEEKDEVADLAAKYDNPEAAVQDELAALKAKLGK